MEAGELRRVKEDLATIKEAVGLELPFGWEDVRWHLIIGVSCLIGLVWALLPHGMRKVWGLVPAAALAIYYMVYLRAKYRRGSGRSPVRRRGSTGTIVAACVVLPLTAAYVYWAKHWHIPARQIIAAGMVWLPFVLVLLALHDRRLLLSGLAILVGMPAAGVAIALWPQVPLYPLTASLLFVGYLVSAGVMAHFLREAERDHAAD
jgi:multisubunit Na+/H+ antiporter MnhB subunit